MATRFQITERWFGTWDEVPRLDPSKIPDMTGMFANIREGDLSIYKNEVCDGNDS